MPFENCQIGTPSSRVTRSTKIENDPLSVCDSTNELRFLRQAGLGPPVGLVGDGAEIVDGVVEDGAKLVRQLRSAYRHVGRGNTAQIEIVHAASIVVKARRLEEPADRTLRSSASELVGRRRGRGHRRGFWRWPGRHRRRREGKHERDDTHTESDAAKAHRSPSGPRKPMQCRAPSAPGQRSHRYAIKWKLVRAAGSGLELDPAAVRRQRGAAPAVCGSGARRVRAAARTARAARGASASRAARRE